MWRSVHLTLTFLSFCVVDMAVLVGCMNQIWDTCLVSWWMQDSKVLCFMLLGKNLLFLTTAKKKKLSVLFHLLLCKEMIVLRRMAELQFYIISRFCLCIFICNGRNIKQFLSFEFKPHHGHVYKDTFLSFF